MQDLAAMARRLRQVKEAYRNFLVLWALDGMAADSDAMDRMAADLDADDQAALADPHDHNWSLLYRGSVLDD